MGSLLRSTICHYCGETAGKITQDHIIPRADLPPLILLPVWFRDHIVVPCCSPCNNEKGALRSDCCCAQCTWVWGTALGEGFFREGYRPRGIIAVVRNRPLHRSDLELTG